MNDYFLGLDMGTSTVGWAVTDMQYNLIRKKGKDMWGIREFEEAETAAGRRAKRVARRNHARSKVRLGYLKDYFHDEISKVDPYFFVRLDNSKYYLEDKDEPVRNKNGIFNDLNYSDVEYYADYPTIFHLRKELLESDKPHDVRLVYLALENMFKHRGHFLNASLSTDEKSDSNMYESYIMLVQLLEENLNISLPSLQDINQLTDILSSRDMNRSQKKEEIMLLWGLDKKSKKEEAIAKAICGLKVDAKALFDVDSEDKIEICFSDSAYEEKEPDLLAAVGDENADIVESMKAIYDAGCLAGILKDSPYLSIARVKDYEKHKKDLAILKKLIKTYSTDLVYNNLFRDAEAGSYSAYVGSVNSDKTVGKQRRNMSGRKREEFYKTVKKYLKDMPADDEDVQYVLAEIEKETFMPKQLTADNGTIPNQVHVKEMKKILSNAEKYLPFLLEKDEGGRTVSDRIVQIFSFQIPYYVGPVSENSAKYKGNGWVVRKESGNVLPWNIDEKIDLKKTSEKFIARMVRKCTYINDERVLPKASLEYEAYCVLNEINNLKIDGEKISVELKQEIYHELFERGKKVTRKGLEKFLTGKGLISESDQLTGIDININNSLSSYGKFYAIFGDDMQTDATKEMVENIIFWCTVYGDSKKFLKEQLEEHYPNLDKDIIKRIIGFKFKDWGNLSKEFLEMQGCDKCTGEVISLIRAMWETNYNMMELLHSEQFDFSEILEKKKTKSDLTLSELTPELLDEFYFSAPVKRMIWQTLKLIREITHIMGGEPKRVFIEMTRSDDEKGDKGRKASRAKQLQELYKNVKDESHNWAKEIENADSSGKLRSKKMYLYFTQLGKCMYTGEPIDLDQLFDDNIYDIDHIYPRHFVKDDSIGNNLVLVKKTTNANKSDIYPLEASIRNSQAGNWKTLVEKGLITKEKYRRLTGNKPFSEEQQADFIARQLVETSQGTKGVADLLKQALPSTEIVYAKAGNVSDFRRDRNMLKSRIVNDMHHAKDAYLNIVVGNVYFAKFTQNPLNFIRKEYMADRKKNNYHLTKMFDWDVARNGEYAWVADNGNNGGGTIVTVRKMMEKNTPLLTRMSFEKKGAISKETIIGKNNTKQDGYLPVKTSDLRLCDVTKYGGYSDISASFFCLVEHERKGKKVRSFEMIPVYLRDISECDSELINYCEKVLLLVNPSIRVREIKIQSLLKVNGYYMHISGKSDVRILMRNAVQMCFDQEKINYIRKIENATKGNNFMDICEENNLKIYDELIKKYSDSIFSKRPNGIREKIIQGREMFTTLDLKAQCQALIEILKISSVGPAIGDLSVIGGASKSGTMRISKYITGNEEVVLIHQSITGIMEAHINLLTV